MSIDEVFEEIKEKLDEIIGSVDSLETDHYNVECDRSDRDKKIEELTEKVNEVDMKIEIIMKHFEIEARTIVYVTQKKGINRELLKRLLASKRYDYERIAEIFGCCARARATGKGGGLDWSSEGAVYPTKYKSWERAKIPLPISRALGRAIKNSRARSFIPHRALNK